MEKQNFKQGDIVYTVGLIDQVVQECEVIAVNDELSEHGTVCDVKPLYIVDKTGKRIQTAEFNNAVLTAKVYRTCVEAYQKIKSDDESLCKMYINSIKTVEDLVKFPLEHLTNGEYTKDIAVQVYKYKVKELLNIEI